MKHVVNPAAWSEWSTKPMHTHNYPCGCYFVSAIGNDDTISVTLCGLHVFRANRHGLPTETAKQCRAVIRELVELHPAGEAK